MPSTDKAQRKHDARLFKFQVQQIADGCRQGQLLDHAYFNPGYDAPKQRAGWPTLAAVIHFRCSWY